MRILREIGMGIFFLSMVGCAVKEVEKTKPKEVVKHDVLVGRVASVNKKDAYVLVQEYRTIPEGMDLIFYGQGAQGSRYSLRLSGQRQGQFVAADLVDAGATVEIGDAIFMRDLEKSEPLEPIVPGKEKKDEKEVVDDVKNE